MTARKWASNQDANGKKIVNLGAPAAGSTQAVRAVDLEATSEADRSRANHTGTQTANTISDFNTQVRTNRLDQMSAPTNPVAFGGQRASGLADPQSPQDAATQAWVKNQLDGLTSGQLLKGDVRAAVTSSVNIASPGATLDGISASNGDVFLLTGQTNGAQNGPYVFNGPTAAMTRTSNWDSATEAVRGSYWIVREGSKADTFALLTNDSITFGTTVFGFTFVGVSAAATPAVEADLGDGVATSFTVTHNLGTRAVRVEVYRNTSPWDSVDVFVGRPSVNSVTIEPDEVWAAGEFHVVVAKM